MDNLYVYDPTAHDRMSKVRGIGRYVQILKENLPDNTIFTSILKNIPYDSTFLNPFFNLLQPPLTMKRIAKKQIAVIHDLIPLKYPKHFPVGIRGTLNVIANKWALRNYDQIITDSQASKKDIVQFLRIPEEKINIVYPILPKIFSSEFNSEFKILPCRQAGYNSKFCLYVGDATWNKNLVNLAKAIQITNIPCVFVGKVFNNSEFKFHSWQRELFQFLTLTRNNPLFIFPGFVSDEDLAHLYKNTICNILVSHDEGFGFSYLEAASFGTPSILSGIPVFHEIAQESALFVNQNHPQEIAEKIRLLDTDKNLREELGKKAKIRAQITFSRFPPSFFSLLLPQSPAHGQ